MKFSKEHKQRISEALVGRTLSKDHRRKISEASKEAWKNPSEAMKKHLREFQKAGIDARREKSLSEEHKRKISEGFTGRKHSEETEKPKIVERQHEVKRRLPLVSIPTFKEDGSTGQKRFVIIKESKEKAVK